VTIIEAASAAADEVANPAVHIPGRTFDAIVVGQGAMGSPATHFLSHDGVNTLGLDERLTPHERGSHAGETRIWRTMIGEGQEYVELAIRELELAHNEGLEIGGEIAKRCGCLVIGNNDLVVHSVTDFLATMQKVKDRPQGTLPHQIFADGASIRANYPVKARDYELALLDQNGGYTFANKFIEENRKLALRHRATIKLNEKVLGYESTPDGVTVKTTNETYSAGNLLIASGAGNTTLLPKEIAQHLTVSRQIVCWWEVHPDYQKRFHMERFPTFIWGVQEPNAPPDGRRANIYGFPLIPGALPGLKVTHEDTSDVVTDLSKVNWQATDEEIKWIYRTYIEPFFDGVGPRCLMSKVCLYTNAPFGRFILDAVPGHHNVRFIAACSGHAFKYARTLAEIETHMIKHKEPPKRSDGSYIVDTSLFTLQNLRQRIVQNNLG
jgi:sarcosine oxidase